MVRKCYTYESISTHKGRKTKRFYDNIKRLVTVDVMKFWGAGQHFWVKIKEDDNLLWEASEKTWVKYPDDEVGMGRVFEDKFNTQKEAMIYIENIIRQHFPSDKYIIEHRNDSESREWYYKDGD